MGKIWLDEFQSITRVCHVETPKAPFACIFKEVSEADSANPEAICGMHVDFGGDQQFVVCATDDETLVFSAGRECPDVEKERIGIKPKKVTETDSSIEEEWDRAWNCVAMEDVPTQTMNKINNILGKNL